MPTTHHLLRALGLLGALAASITPITARAATITTDSGDTLDLTLAAQLRVDATLAEDTVVRLHRMRPGLMCASASGARVVRAVFNTTPGNLELMDLWAQQRLRGRHTLRVGQLKVPLLAYRQGSGMTLQIVDWSPLTAYLGGERQLGAVWRYEAPATGGLAAQLGVFQGQNVRRGHGIGVPLLRGQGAQNPSALADGGQVGAPHPELFGMLHHTHRARGWGAHLSASAAFDARPNAAQDWRWRAGLEAGFARGPLRVEALVATAALDADPSLWAAMLEVGWQPHPIAGLAMRATSIATTEAAREALRPVRADGDPMHTLGELAVAASLHTRDDDLKLVVDLVRQHVHHDAQDHAMTRARLMLQLRL